MERLEKRPVTIHVAGRAYTLMSDDPPEYIIRVAELAERKLAETAIASRQSQGTAAVLACIALADELLQAQEENSVLRRRMQRMIEHEDGSTCTGR
ncbi:MAG: cell division protein ZapA [Clostridia bacterium]|nr:cell division protein ZapA [Clostridia bacterium]